MAPASTAQAKKHDEEPKNGTTAAEAPKQETAAPVKDRFLKIETERYMYNPNKVGDKTLPLTGYLLNLLKMPDLKGGREWYAFLVKLTEPTNVINREKDVISTPTGSEVLIPATHQLTQFFERASVNPHKCFEVRIIPKKKIDIGGGQTMWIYDLGVDMTTQKDRTAFGPVAMLGAPKATTMQQAVAEGVASSPDDEIPF
jgi:hypothetical protein